MSSNTADKYKGNIVQLLLFIAVLAAATYGFQTFVIKPLFKKAMVGLFAPPELQSVYHGQDTLSNSEFIFDASSRALTLPTSKYEKSAGEWVIQAEKLGEDAIRIQPWITFGIFSLFFGFVMAVIITTMLPRQIGYISNKIEREIDNTIDKIDEQTGDKLSRDEIERITAPTYSMRNDEHKAIQTEFGEIILNEIGDVKNAKRWRKNKVMVFKGLRLYMTRHFAEKYANNVQGFAYGGAAILIVIIGIRGLKFIPPTQPSILLAAITLEFSMLTLLAVTLFYTEEEQRMDKLMRNLEESSEGQKYELINLVRASQQQQRDLASMVDYISRQTDNLQRMADALTGANREYIIQVAQRAVAEYVTKETSMEITEKVIREKIDSALSQMFGNKQLEQ